MKDFCINSLCASCDKCVYLLDCYPDYYDQCPDERWEEERDWEDEEEPPEQVGKPEAQ